MRIAHSLWQSLVTAVLGSAATELPRNGTTLHAPEAYVVVRTRTASHGRLPCVLIVDDSADLRDILEMLLTDEGFRTLACATVEAALALLDVEPVHQFSC